MYDVSASDRWEYKETGAKYSMATQMLSVRLSVCNVEVLWSYRFGYFESNIAQIISQDRQSSLSGTSLNLFL